MNDGLTNPFPGMNPYLEARQLWPEVHNKLISEIHYFLREALPPRYTVTMEERVIVEESIGDVTRQRYAIPDLSVAGDAVATGATVNVEALPDSDAGAVTVLVPELRPVREWYIEIRTQSQQPSVTILEILSHSNKRTGRGRRDYIEKRQRILESATHLVEIDLLRGNNPMPVEGYDGAVPYRILVSHSRMRPQAALYPFGLQACIPDFAIPLLGDDQAPIIELGEICDDIYLRGLYGRYVSYNNDPPGPLSDEDREWIDELLREKGLRQ